MYKMADKDTELLRGNTNFDDLKKRADMLNRVLMWYMGKHLARFTEMSINQDGEEYRRSTRTILAEVVSERTHVAETKSHYRIRITERLFSSRGSRGGLYGDVTDIDPVELRNLWLYISRSSRWLRD